MIEFSESFTEIAAAFAKAQVDFPELTADSEGQIEGESKASGRAFSFAYDYASLGKVLNTYRPVLAKNGIAILQPAEHKPIDGGVGVVVQTWLLHSSGQFMRSPKSYTVAPGGDLKKAGGAITYLRRYQLGALLGVAPEEDTDDGQGRHKENVQKAPTPTGSGNFTCRHGHRHTTAQGARDCQDGPAQETPFDRPGDPTLSPGFDPVSMDGPDPLTDLRELLGAKNWSGALEAIGKLPAKSELRAKAEQLYSAAKQPGKAVRA